MSDNQPINGYRELSQLDIDTINLLKKWGDEIGQFIRTLELDPAIDQRWLEVGKIDLQRGIMSCVRAIAKPTNF